MQDYLRKEVRLLKALQQINFVEIADLLEIKTSSFYSWLRGQYNLSESNVKRLQEIINNLQE